MTTEEIKRLAMAAGIDLQIIATIEGGDYFSLTIDDLPRFVVDHEQFVAKQYNTTVPELRAFQAARMSLYGQMDAFARVQCSAKTARGKRCKAHVIPREDCTGPSQYAEACRRGGYCLQHSEGT